MLWIGLTGGIASGKSTVSKMLRARGLEIVDADLLAREVVRAGEPAHSEIIAAFGPGVVSDDGELNRRKIGELVFSDPKKLLQLEAITHPRVRALTAERRASLERAGATLAFYDVPLLFEKKMSGLFDRTVAIVCARSTQIERAVLRDGLTSEEAERRVRAQLPIEEKAKLADFVIYNDLGLKELEAEVDKCVVQLRALAHQAQT